MVQKLVIFCGQRGAGKGTLSAAMSRRFSQLKRVPTHTTRAPRNGEVDGVDYIFVSAERFETLRHDGELIDFIRISDTQSSGLSKTEFSRHEYGVTDLAPRMARSISDFILRREGQVLVLGVYAPEEQRRERIRRREKGISRETVERLLREDPVTDEAMRAVASTVIANDKQNNLQAALQSTEKVIREFLDRG